jgi:hypothetical protein
MSPSPLLFVVILLILFVGVPPFYVKADELASRLPVIWPAVAYIVLPSGRGSGFVVGSNEHESVVATNAALVSGGAGSIHVFVSSNAQPVSPSGLASDAATRIALLTIPVGNLPVLRLASHPVAPAHVVAAGYSPRSLSSDFMAPTSHANECAGELRAVNAALQKIEHSVHCDANMQGGPIVDADNGLVVGMVEAPGTQPQSSSFDLSSDGIIADLVRLGSAIQPDKTSAPTLSTNRLIVTMSTFQNDDFQSAQKAGSDVALKAIKLDVPVKYVFNHLQSIDGKTVQGACFEQNAIGAIFVDVSSSLISNTPNSTSQLMTTARVHFGLRFVDCDGDVEADIWNDRLVTEPTDPNHLLTGINIAPDLAAGVADALHKALSSDSELRNFFRYGIFVPDSGSRAMFRLTMLSPAGATVVYAPHIGAAGRARLSVGDEVSSVNGHSTANLSQQALDSLEAASDHWNLAVHAPDGQDFVVSIKPEPLSWYLSHLTYSAWATGPCP